MKRALEARAVTGCLGECSPGNFGNLDSLETPKCDFRSYNRSLKSVIVFLKLKVL